MKQIILVTHGDFAKGILTSLKLVMGTLDYIDFVSIHANETIPEITDMIRKKMSLYEKDTVTVIISDIAGGSTTRAALELLSEKEHTYLITGLNLGLLLEVAMLPLSGDGKTDEEALRTAIESSKSTMALVNDRLNEDLDDESESGEL